MDSGSGVHEATPSAEQDRREGSGTAQSSKVETAQHGHGARSEEGVGKQADGSPGTTKQDPLKASAAKEESADVPVEPEFSSFNYWRQPVAGLDR